MARKLVIVQNGLVNLQGHYYETAVATAEAARDHGLTPILAANVRCKADIIPDWLPFHPVCRTDHYMAPPAASPSLASRLKQRVKRFLPRPLLAAIRAQRRSRRSDPRVFDGPMTTLAIESALTSAGLADEFCHLTLFEEDLERLLEAVGVDAGDDVFLPTAHGRELVAIGRVVERRGPAWSPAFHLEFRHALDLEDPTAEPWVAAYSACQRLHFALYRAAPQPSIFCYTDTPELTEEYAQLSCLPFGTLPIPFRSGLITPRVPSWPLCVVYLGDARDEKGFHWLAPLTRALKPEMERRAVRFAFQATLTDAGINPQSHRAYAWLRRHMGDGLELLGDRQPLTPEAYFALVSRADVILCPYDPRAYRRRSSGILTEAIAAGTPTVVPAGSWLQRQQPPGSGETFTDLATFLAAVRRLIAEHGRYRACALAGREAWLATHTPANLVRALLAARVPLANAS